MQRVHVQMALCNELKMRMCWSLQQKFKQFLLDDLRFCFFVFPQNTDSGQNKISTFFLWLTLVALARCWCGPPAPPHYAAVDTDACAGLANETLQHWRVNETKWHTQRLEKQKHPMNPMNKNRKQVIVNFEVTYCLLLSDAPSLSPSHSAAQRNSQCSDDRA